MGSLGVSHQWLSLCLHSLQCILYFNVSLLLSLHSAPFVSRCVCITRRADKTWLNITIHVVCMTDSAPQTACSTYFPTQIPAEDLTDTYLPAWQAVVEDGHVGSIMCSCEQEKQCLYCLVPFRVHDVIVNILYWHSIQTTLSTGFPVVLRTSFRPRFSGGVSTLQAL